VLIGDLETLLKPLRESKLEAHDTSVTNPGKARLSDKPEITTREDIPMSIIRISNLDTVCQVSTLLNPFIYLIILLCFHDLYTTLTLGLSTGVEDVYSGLA
jgi:hypothetical protein